MARKCVFVLLAAVALVAGACSSDATSSQSPGGPITSGRAEDPRVQRVIRQVKAQFGSDFTDAEVACMGRYAVQRPELLDATFEGGATPTADQSRQLLQMVASCSSKDKLVDYLLKSVVGNRTAPPERLACIRAKLLELPTEELASAAADGSSQSAVVSKLMECAGTGSTATAATPVS